MNTFLSLNNVSLHFANVTKPALAQINYQIKAGDFVILLGNNGSGKSTLLRLLHRYYEPDSGDIHFMGLPLRSHHNKSFAKAVAVLTQNCSESLFSSLTIYENYLLTKHQSFFTLINHRHEKLAAQHYLTEYNTKLGEKLDVPVEKLSGGEKQALALALCLLHPPALLLLDEHTSALDPKTSEQIMQLTQRMINKHNITCILTTHNLDIALTYGNRILLLQNGRVRNTYNAEVKQLITRDELMSHYC